MLHRATWCVGGLAISIGAGAGAGGSPEVRCATQAQPQPLPQPRLPPDLQPDSSAPDPSQAWVVDDQNLRREYPKIEARSRRIRAALAGPRAFDALPDDHWAREWAGEYRMGRDMRLILSPHDGIAYTWEGCLGLDDGNHGEIAGTFDLDEDGRADGLTIEWVLHPQTGHGFDSGRYFFVRWDGPDGAVARRYLAPESQMIALVNSLNNHPDWFVGAACKIETDAQGRVVWPEPAAAGKVHLPEPWASMLRLGNIDGEVLEVSASEVARVMAGVDVTTCMVVVDAGTEDGIFVGLEAMYLSRGAVATLTAVTVEAERTVLEFRASHSPGGRVVIPQVGERLHLAGHDKP